MKAGSPEARAKWAPRRPEYYVQTGSMFDNPHGVPRDEIVRFILENSVEVVAQVVFGKYVESSGLVFTGELIQMLFDRKQPIVTSDSFTDRAAVAEAEHYLRATRGWQYRYYTGVDLARQTDYTVIFTIDTQVWPARVVHYRRLNRVPWETIYREVGRAVMKFGRNVLVDSTGPGGDVVMDALESRYYCPVHDRTILVDAPFCTDRNGALLDHPREFEYVALDCCDGFHFTGTTKKELVEHLRNVLSVGYDSTTPDVGFGWLRCPPIPQLEEELAFYAWDDKKLSTDCLFALALAAWHGLEDPAVDAHVGSPFAS